MWTLLFCKVMIYVYFLASTWLEWTCTVGTLRAFKACYGLSPKMALEKGLSSHKMLPERKLARSLSAAPLTPYDVLHHPNVFLTDSFLNR